MNKEICWNVTTRCNQCCKYCHRFLNLKDLSVEDNKRILNNLIESGIKEITWTGGEALLLDGIDELLEISYNNGIKNKLITNGMLLTIDKLNKIGKYLDSITLSIDSINDEINREIGRGINHFNVIKNILDYVNNLNIKVRINSVACSYNKNSFDNLINFLNNYNIYSWRIFKFMPLRNKAIENKNDFNITMDEYENIVKLINEKSNIKNVDTRTECDMENKYLLILADGSITVTENGIDKKIGNALNTNIGDLI